jgi:hypothetical protein
MAIARNVGTSMTKKAGGGGDDETPSKPAARPRITLPAAAKPPAPTRAVPPGRLATEAPRPEFINAGIISPALLNLRADFTMRTTTQVAQEALERLRKASPAVVDEAVTTVNNKRVAAKDMMRYLERKVIVGEVLNVAAAKWAADTREDFAEAFQMANTKTDVMDAIVAIAILNDPDLLDELRDENVSDATDDDLLENRRVVAQYPPPGTPLEAPYLVLVAVEYRDTRQADEIIESITGDLVEHQGFKLPRRAASGQTRGR